MNILYALHKTPYVRFDNYNLPNAITQTTTAIIRTTIALINIITISQQLCAKQLIRQPQLSHREPFACPVFSTLLLAPSTVCVELVSLFHHHHIRHCQLSVCSNHLFVSYISYFTFSLILIVSFVSCHKLSFNVDFRSIITGSLKSSHLK